MTDERTRIELDGAVAHLIIDRPEKLNALDAAMVDALATCCRQLERMDAVRCVILRGAGGRAFCAGGDIDAWHAETAENFARFWVREGHDAFDRLARLRQPVIAVLDGHCLGGGLELAACADLRIAEAQIKVGQPECGLGIIPGWSGTQRAVRRFGSQAVRRMALVGEILKADEALALGIVDCVVGKGEALGTALERARLVCNRGPRAVEVTKMLINAAEGEESERILESLAGAIAAQSDQLKEGVAAFKEKRAPKF